MFRKIFGKLTKLELHSVFSVVVIFYIILISFFLDLPRGHTIGPTWCAVFNNRLIFQQNGKSIFNIEFFLSVHLAKHFPTDGNVNMLMSPDPVTLNTFGNNYFVNLHNHMGLIQSDQELFSTLGASTISIANDYRNNQDDFFSI